MRSDSGDPKHRSTSSAHAGASPESSHVPQVFPFNRAEKAVISRLKAALREPYPFTKAHFEGIVII